MNDLSGKKLLILGGSYQHRKIVKKAKELGIETYLTDYLDTERSPAKQMADHRYMINITETDALIELCKKENIDGIIAPYLDVTQLPYFEICKAMGYPCFGDEYQHKILTDKREFTGFCREHGTDVIPSYTVEQIERNEVEYPILIKPADSRGSRGQTVCRSINDVEKAIRFAKSESRSGGVIAEKYMGRTNDIQLAYIVIDGEPILYKVEDRYSGEPADGLDKIAIACVSPSVHEKLYREKADKKVKEMIRALKLKNSPVFIQAFMDGETARLYDPGIRMPGDDYDDAHKILTGIDIPELLIRFALTGEMSANTAELIKTTRLDKYAVMILPCLKPGKIKTIEGIDKIKRNTNIVTFSSAYAEGDVVKSENTVKQRFGEFVMTASDKYELKSLIDWLFATLHVYDENGEDMLIAKFDTALLEPYEW